ncbi:MAG TPA: hypothetical protein DEF18_08410 [Muricauda sp.]|nr:hypothetical protein [Allomuricauda sp.]
MKRDIPKIPVACQKLNAHKRPTGEIMEMWKVPLINWKDSCQEWNGNKKGRQIRSPVRTHY